MATPDQDKFAAFTRRDLVYSTVKGHNLYAAVLVPKSLRFQASRPHPVLVHWHGGGFVTGHRTYAPWWSRWSLQLALAHDAIIVSPDYRLIPESSGEDVLSDVARFWNWLADDLPSVALQEGWDVVPDLARITTYGSSSGGFLAVQSALLAPKTLGIRAVISVSAPFYTGHGSQGLVPMPRMIFGAWPPPPREAEKCIREYIRAMKPGVIRSESDPADSWDLLLSIIQQAWVPRLLDVQKNKRLDVIKLLDTLETMPPMWIIHGEEDSVVPAAGSQTFVNAMREKLPDVPIHVTIRPGNHGFELGLGLEEHWVRNGCRFVEQYWP
ncbi:alpha/beta-hydrolase [Apiospora arundinis]